MDGPIFFSNTRRVKLAPRQNKHRKLSQDYLDYRKRQNTKWMSGTQAKQELVVCYIRSYDGNYWPSHQMRKRKREVHQIHLLILIHPDQVAPYHRERKNTSLMIPPPPPMHACAQVAHSPNFYGLARYFMTPELRKLSSLTKIGKKTCK